MASKSLEECRTKLDKNLIAQHNLKWKVHEATAKVSSLEGEAKRLIAKNKLFQMDLSQTREANASINCENRTLKSRLHWGNEKALKKCQQAIPEAVQKDSAIVLLQKSERYSSEW